MPSVFPANPTNHDSYWSGVRGILAIQLAVLFALSVVVLVYLDWSSHAATAQFLAGRPSASEPSHLPQSGPLLPVKRRMACPRKA